MLMPYIGGVRAYRQKCDDIAVNGYRGFSIGPAGVGYPLTNNPGTALTHARPLRKWEGEGQHPMTEKLRDKARALGLERLTDQHLEQFKRAMTGMERHLRRVPRG